MQPLKLIIPLNGLAQGVTEFSWRIDKEFFVSFENTEIIGADLDVNVRAQKSGRYIGIDCDIDGDVTVPCDRCLEDLHLPVHTTALQSIKFGAEPAGDNVQEGEREIVFLPDTDTDLDLSQTVYDYVCVALPLQRVHEEGECNPETVKYLKSEDEIDDDPKPSSEPVNSPFAALKGLLDAKN